MSRIMQLTRVAPITLAQKDSQDKEPCHQAMASEPSTPQAAHSVAVAQPNSSDRNTNTISNTTGMRLSDSATFAANGIGGSAGGVRCGLRMDQPAMYPE